MKKRKLGLLIGTIALLGLIIATLALWTKHLSPLTPGQFIGVLRSNEVRSVITAARSAARGAPATTLITVDGTDQEFPLPNGATTFGDRYLIHFDELQPYLDRLASNGYILEDQWDSSIYNYRNDALGILVFISAQQYPGNMYLFFIDITSQEDNND